MVDITVGPEKKLFRVYKKLLCDKVPYFAKMFGTGFKEAVEGQAEFPEDKPESFGLLMEWIYFGTFAELAYLPNSLVWNWDALALYALSEKMWIIELKDRVMDQLYDLNKQEKAFLSPTSIETVYANTADGSPLRRYACRIFRYGLLQVVDHEEWKVEKTQKVMSRREDLAKDVLLLMRGTSGSAARLPFEQFQKCDFHHHGKDETCPYESRHKAWTLQEDEDSVF